MAISIIQQPTVNGLASFLFNSKSTAIYAPPPSLSHFSIQTKSTHYQCFASTSPTQYLLSLRPSAPNPQPLFISEPFIDCSSSSSSFSNSTDYDYNGLFSLLRLSVRCSDAELARAAHATILKLEEDIYLGNALIAAYIKLGFLTEAYRVFLGLSCPNVVSYTALISGFSKSNRKDEAVQLFFRMRNSGIEPNEYSFVAILTACIRALELELGLQVHAMVIKTGYLDCVFVSNALMGLYGKCCFSDSVVKLFGKLPRRDLASWNTAISSLAKEALYGKAFELFCNMRQNDNFGVDYFTLSTLLAACADCNAFAGGQVIHAHAIKVGLEADLSVTNALIGFYIKCEDVKGLIGLFERMHVRDVYTWTQMITAFMKFGLVDLALETFEKMPEKNSVSYNALLTGFCENNGAFRALDLFIRMLGECIEMTEFTLCSVVNACALLGDSKISEQIHGFSVKFGFESNPYIEAALLDMCTRCGRMEDARKMFHQWPITQDNSIVLTSMVCGYARNAQLEEAISLFHHSQLEGTLIMDEVASTSLLSLCAAIGFHEMGKQIHCHAVKSGLLTDQGVGNAMVNMYAKCWNMEAGIEVFNSMSSHDLVSWNSLIAGHLLHRQGDEALAVWSKMKEAGIHADELTFTLVILAYRCTNSNLVGDCRSLFFSMREVYGIEQTSQHVASFVRVLGYWDLLEEAEEMINKLSFEPDVSVWRALLDSCRIHVNTTIGKRAAKNILAMEPKDPSTCILVSNLYSASGRWHCSEMVRENMRATGFQKHPVRSWVIHDDKINSFCARDQSHLQEKDIYSGLGILILECQKAGYVPDTSFVLHEVEEYQKKDFLFYHSAKLAAAYGLLTTKPGKPIRIVKNVLLCGDCHTFLKYISIVSGREIFLRDSSGFHCFSSGQCSCKDHW